MLRTRRRLGSACLTAGLIVASCAGLGTPLDPAEADSTDGTLTVSVQRDVDRNGQYDSNIDSPQPGIKITVSDAGGKAIDGETDSNGDFVLGANDTLTGGRYFVVAEIPAALGDLVPVSESDSFQSLSTTADVTSESAAIRMGVAVRDDPPDEPGPEPAPERRAVSPPPREQEAPRFAVGDYIWKDTNRSGEQDPGEPAASRVSVQLLDSSGDVVDSTVSSASGRYLFDKLSAGTYSVRFAGIQAGFKLTASVQGGDRGQDSDPDYTGVTPPFTLGVGEANVRPTTVADEVQATYINASIDAGITPLRYAVASRVWIDLNRDGVLQPDEPGATATVSLLAADRSVVATTATDGQGRYQFTDLRAGRYRLQFSDLPAHRAFTTLRAGNAAAADSDVDPTSGLVPVFTLDQNAPNLMPAADAGVAGADFVNASLGAGLVGSYSLGDTVWRDQNGNGVLDPGDGGVPGVTVKLMDSSRQLVATKRTSRSGRYTFDALPAGVYAVEFSDLPVGLIFTTSHVGSNPAVDSDPGVDGTTGEIGLGDDNPADTSLDAGLTTPASLQAPAAAAGSGLVPAADTTLSATGGVLPGIPLAGLALVLGGAACLLHGRRRHV
ncbi:MAG TPA: SdrD B-like domain-containing protein [Propionibacteriaceae bacterium]